MIERLLPIVVLLLGSLALPACSSTRMAYGIVRIEMDLLDRTPSPVTVADGATRIIRAGDAAVPELIDALRSPVPSHRSLGMYVLNVLVRGSNQAAIAFVEERLREGERIDAENALLMALSAGGYEGRSSLAALMRPFLDDRRIIGFMASSVTKERARRACDLAAFVVQTSLGIDIGARPWRHDDKVVARAIACLATVR